MDKRLMNSDKRDGVTKETLENLVNSDDRWKKICPRCGYPIVGYPALSRYTDVNICSDCGTSEAYLDYFSCFSPKKNEDWYAVRYALGDDDGE